MTDSQSQAVFPEEAASGWGRKSRPNHQEYLRALERLGPEGRIRKAFELSELSKSLFREGLRRQFPDLSEAEFYQLYLSRLALCHNRNY